MLYRDRLHGALVVASKHLGTLGQRIDDVLVALEDREGFAGGHRRVPEAVSVGGLRLDLPFERTAERIAYRESFVNLETSVRSVQALEDQIKLSVRNSLRQMLTDRESVRIQVEAVRLARDRVNSTNLLLEARLN